MRRALFFLVLSGCSLRFGEALDRFPNAQCTKPTRECCTSASPSKECLLDSDGDGLPDWIERIIGTDPYQADTDHDGIPDGQEVGPDPFNPIDSNGDGIPDALDSSTATIAPVTDLSQFGGGGTMTGGGTTGGGTTGGGTTGGGGTSGGTGGTVGTGDNTPSVIPGFCQGIGPLTTIDGGVQVCGGDLAKEVFKYAMCSCGDMSLSNHFGTASIDQIVGGVPVGQNGSIGCNGNLTVGNTATIMGSVLQKGTFIKNPGCNLQVGDFYDYGASTNNCVSAGAGKTTHETDPSWNPCDHCDAASRLNIANIVAPFATSNDDAYNSIPPDFLKQTTSARSLTLTCGAYYFSEITPQAQLSITVNARVAIFVAGDFTKSAGLTINFGPKGELDLFVAGKIQFTTPTTIGDVNQPSRLRVYIGGSTFSIGQQTHLYGFFYAPGSDFVFQQQSEVRGGLVAGSITIGNQSSVYFDPSVFTLQGCVQPVVPPPGSMGSSGPPPACMSDLQCGSGNPVCDTTTGQCTDCTSVACSGPLVCQTFSGGESNYAAYCTGSTGTCTGCVLPATCVGEGCPP
jgi:hypothetical protein